jgi:hypothetical protein
VRRRHERIRVLSNFRDPTHTPTRPAVPSHTREDWGQSKFQWGGELGPAPLRIFDTLAPGSQLIFRLVHMVSAAPLSSPSLPFLFPTLISDSSPAALAEAQDFRLHVFHGAVPVSLRSYSTTLDFPTLRPQRSLKTKMPRLHLRPRFRPSPCNNDPHPRSSVQPQ